MKKKIVKILAICVSILIISGMVNLSNMVIAQAPDPNLEKVEARVLESLSTKGTSDYVIEIGEKADLSQAYSISDWNERGWFVYDTLKEVAARTQKPVIEILEKQGVKYQSFFAGNEIAVTASDLGILSEIAALDSVSHIRYPRTATIDPGYLSIQETTVTQGSINALDWGITDTKADQFWAAFGMQGDGLVVANIDTGVQWDHPALDQAFKCGTNPSDPACWADPSNICGGSACDNNGHGTHTMGTMVGDDDPSLTYQVGMAPNAQWIACKGCESSSCSDTALNGCADWIVAPGGNPANRPNIVNNSWGGGGGDTWYLAKVTAWRAAGIFPAFSAGNSGPTCSSLGDPGDYQESFAAASHMSSRTISDFSSRGPSSVFGDDPYTKPNISAPGSSICSSVPGGGWDCTYSGTSMASPHVAGAVALLWSCNASLIGDMETTFELLQDNADSPPAGNCGAPADGEGNYTYGYGYLNVLAAGQQVCSAGVLAGTVTDGTNPIDGATVTADNGAGLSMDTLTLPDGTYTLNVPGGTYTVSATKYGYSEDVETGVVVVEGATTTQDFVIPQLGMSLVSGYVYDGGVEGLGAHGYPLYSAIHITATDFDQTIYTDPFTGYYEIELVQDTEHTFVTTPVPAGYGSLVEAVTATGASYSHDIIMMVNGEDCSAPGYGFTGGVYKYTFEGSAAGFVSSGTNSSWARGIPTVGPGSAHGGQYVIATNPGGNYNASEDSYMTSPVMNLSGYATSPIIHFWDWKHLESATFDRASLEATKDGGVTWNVIYGPVGGVSDTEWHERILILDASYNVPDFQMRFRFESDTSLQYEGWYIDDITVFPYDPPERTIVISEDFEATNGAYTHSGTADEWEWGTPSYTFTSCGSGAKCWGTDLDNTYDASSNQVLLSPVIDLSGVTLPPGETLDLTWKQAWNIESASWDHGYAAISINGGAFVDMWSHTGGTITQPWTDLAYDITSAVGGNIQLRWTLTSDSSVNYAGLYVDKVEIGYGEDLIIEPPEATCSVIPGGVVAGYVYDDNDNSLIVGADVYSDVVATQTFFIPEDPASEGLFWVFHPTMTDPEDVDFTASKALYGSDIATVSIYQDAINQQDFYLGTGELEFDPESLEVTMLMGAAPVTETLTISNGGTSDAMFEIVEKDDGFELPMIPAFKGELPEDTRPVSIGLAPDAGKASALTASEDNPFKGLLAGEPAFAIDLTTDSLKYIPDTTIPGTWNDIGATMTSLFAGDFLAGDFTTLYAISYDNNNLYTVDVATGTATLVGTSTPPGGQSWTGLSGTPDGTLYGLTTDITATTLVTVDPGTGAVTVLGALPGLAGGIDLAYNTDDDMIYIVDLVTDSLFRVDPATMAVTEVGSLGVAANYAQGMDFEEESGVLYWAAYTTQGELRIIDTTTGASTLVGAFPGGAEVDSLAFATGGQSDVPWLSEDPVSGIVPADGSIDIEVTFDPAGLTQPGHYLAELKVKHDTPYTYPNIPVVLHLLAPGDYGTFNGYVMGYAACDVNPAALQGATVNFWQGGVIAYTTTTNAAGYYSYAVPEGMYDIEVMMDGYISDIEFGQDVLGGDTVTVDFTLRLEAPCISVDPTSLEQTQPTDTVTSQTLTIMNTGAGDGVFELFEMPVAHLNADVELILDDGVAEDSIGLTTGGQFIWLNRFTPAADAFPFTIDEIQVILNNTVSLSDQFQVVIYSDTDGDGDPGTGAVYLGGQTFTAQFNDMATFNVFTLTEPVAVDGPGDVLVGLVNRSGTAGYSDYPAAIDQTASQNRSWIGAYSTGNPPAVPPLPTDDLWGIVDSFGLPGNWTLRAMGSSAAGDILWLSLDPTAGVVPADSETDVTVTYDSTGLALGDYFAAIRVKNLPAAAINVPVTLHVTELNKLFLPLILR